MLDLLGGPPGLDCDVHVFDPSGAYGHETAPPGVTYHGWGIKSGASDDDTALGAPPRGVGDPDFKTFGETVEELGHGGRVLDVLKVDCKMCEWSTFQDWFPESSGLGRISQILVETHGTPEAYVEDFFVTMRQEGYVIFHKEAATADFGGTCQDYSFLKLAPEFFEETGRGAL